VPIAQLEEGSFEDGYGFDGSSIRGWQGDSRQRYADHPGREHHRDGSFTAVPTVQLHCNIVDPITKEKYSRDPRNIAQKAEAYLKSTGIADTAFFGPEAEFFIFDDIRVVTARRTPGTTSLTSVEETVRYTAAKARTSATVSAATTRRAISRAPHDSMSDMRSRLVLVMEQVGIAVEAQHHEVATGGQAEIDMKFNSLTKIADSLMWYKYILKNVARRHGKHR